MIMKIAGIPAALLAAGMWLLSSSQAAEPARADVFASHFARLRIERVDAGLAEGIRTRCKELTFDKPLKGLVLDLRFAQGQDFAEAAAVADLFLAKEKKLAAAGGREFKSASKKDALNLPVVVLVNRETTGAAELLAAILREQRVGLLLGARTAGGGSATLAEGAPLPANGLEPDIPEIIGPADEKAYLANAYAELPAAKSTAAPASTNRPPRLNEAELVRRQREGQAREEDTVAASSKAGAAPEGVRDPVLARALDLLKGLAVARQARAL